MILTIDIGNTNQTYSVFKERDNILFTGSLRQLEKDLIINNINYSDLNVFVSSVNDSKLDDINKNFTRANQFLTKKHFFDMPVNYSNSIGEDRLLAAYYLFKETTEPKIIIDSGSFTTIDFINNKGFQGGFILPGLEKIKRCYQQGENLAEISSSIKLKTTLQLEKELPNDTATAIYQGIMASFYYSIQGIIQSHFPKEKPSIHITGGNRKILFDYLSSIPTFDKVSIKENLIHKSLFLISSKKEVH